MIWEAAILNDLADREQDETARLRRLDTAALSAAVERYRHRLYRYLYRLVRDEAAAEDLFQQTWLNVVRQMGRFDGRSTFETWLFAIAHNAAMDLLRRRRPESLDEATLPSGGAAADAFGLAVTAEQAAILDQATALLPAAYREVLTLRFEEGMKLEEIAEVTRSPLSTVKSRLHRALESVRLSLAGRWRKEDLL
jgi:RNA polymerase sigma-70 factor (ECF subfamily)